MIYLDAENVIEIFLINVIFFSEPEKGNYIEKSIYARHFSFFMHPYILVFFFNIF